MVWRFHSKVDTSGGASGGNSLLLSTVNAADHGGESSSSSADGNSVARGNADFITMDDLVQGMADTAGR